MFSNYQKIWVVVLLSLLFSLQAFGSGLDDEEESYGTVQVARIKFLKGEAQIKRLDDEDWEVAVVNLPVVEGDEIQTGPDTRLELQFDTDTYLRLDENSNLKIVSFDEEGVAVSLSTGTLGLTVLKFDPEKGYFELDAPKTTVAIAGEGRYRIDAGNEWDKQVRISVTDGGKARVYSLDSGFTLQSDQSAAMQLEGTYAGEWEVSRNTALLDDFEDWSAKRDELINRSLKDAHYGRYYDSDIYGADDLNDYGFWQYNSAFGYLWQPYVSSTSDYRNWSPYRYGQWRWLPYFGWSWVNDEPWGWATYHHGRWIFLSGRWYWTPYSYNAYYRSRRSWWRPAIVYIGYVGNNICWYPLPYNYSYYDYNRRYRNYWRNHRRDRRNDRRDDRRGTPPGNRTDAPNDMNIARANRLRTPPLGRVPANGVITTPGGTFGRTTKGFDTAPPDVSREILKTPPVIANTPPIIPDRTEIGKKMSPEILIIDRKPLETKRKIPIGAGERKIGEPLDEKLKKQKIYGNRPPLTTVPRVIPSENPDRKGTGAVERRRNNAPGGDPRKADEPTRSTFPKIDRTPPVRYPDQKETRKPPETKSGRTPPIYQPSPRNRPVERKPAPPTYTPPPRKADPPRRSDPPNRTPPIRNQDPPTRSAPPKRSPPVRKQDPPPSRPKGDKKPAPKSPPFARPKTDS